MHLNPRSSTRGDGCAGNCGRLVFDTLMLIATEVRGSGGRAAHPQDVFASERGWFCCRFQLSQLGFLLEDEWGDYEVLQVSGRAQHKTCGSPDRQGRKWLDKPNMCDDSERVYRVGLTAMRDPGTKEQYRRERFQKPQTGKFSPQI